MFNVTEFKFGIVIYSVCILILCGFLFIINENTVLAQKINYDLNGDGKVDQEDIILLLAAWGSKLELISEDFDNNKKVNTIDFDLILLNLGTNPPVITDSCLDQEGPLIVKSGIYESRWDARSSDALAANTKVDAKAASWIALWPLQDKMDYPIVFGGESGLCFSGGEIVGNYPDKMGDPVEPWDYDPYATWSYIAGTSAMEIKMPNFVLENIRIHNFGDGISLNSDTESNFIIRGVYFSKLRDDCIENDHMRGGLVEDSLFDGCYTAFSTRPQCSDCDSSSKIWIIRDSLVRLEPMDGVYKNRGPVPGHAGFFKWDTSSADISPKLALHNNIFRVDQESGTVGLGVPAGKIESCSNNIMVWLGEGSYPDPNDGQDPLPQDCFTITTDKSIWDNAVSQWKAEHGFD
jgi:hypothetical protein